MPRIQQQAASAHFASSFSLVNVPVGPESIAPIMDFEVCFISSENELRETQSAVKRLTIQLEYFLKSFGTQILTEKPSNSPPPPPQLPASTITTPTPISRLHPANPSDFDGDRSKGRVFLNSCELVYTLCLSDFTNDHSHVLWTLSFMKTGRANSFIEQTLQWEARRGPRYASYAAF